MTNQEHAKRAIMELLEDELPEMVEHEVKKILRRHATEAMAIAAQHDNDADRNAALTAYFTNWLQSPG